MPPQITGANKSDDGSFDSLTPRGFTGHEMLDDLGLVHMNGRIYDPLLGRMLSADITVQSPGSLQSYNRYSYVNNNPLRFTDPSGFASSDLIKTKPETPEEEKERLKREKERRDAIDRDTNGSSLLDRILDDYAGAHPDVASQAATGAANSAQTANTPLTARSDSQATTSAGTGTKGEVAQSSPTAEAKTAKEGTGPNGGGAASAGLPTEATQVDTEATGLIGQSNDKACGPTAAWNMAVLAVGKEVNTQDNQVLYDKYAADMAARGQGMNMAEVFDAFRNFAKGSALVRRAVLTTDSDTNALITKGIGDGIYPFIGMANYGSNHSQVYVPEGSNTLRVYSSSISWDGQPGVWTWTQDRVQTKNDSYRARSDSIVRIKSLQQ